MLWPGRLSVKSVPVSRKSLAVVLVAVKEPLSGEIFSSPGAGVLSPNLPITSLREMFLSSSLSEIASIWPPSRSSEMAASFVLKFDTPCSASLYDTSLGVFFDVLLLRRTGLI